MLFFVKGAPTRKVWYYSLDVGRNMGKTNPLDAESAEVLATIRGLLLFQFQIKDEIKAVRIEATKAYK